MKCGTVGRTKRSVSGTKARTVWPQVLSPAYAGQALSVNTILRPLITAQHDRQMRKTNTRRIIFFHGRTSGATINGDEKVEEKVGAVT